MAIDVGERVRRAVGALDLEEHGVPRVSVSVGVAVASVPDQPIEALVAEADAPSTARSGPAATGWWRRRSGRPPGRYHPVVPRREELIGVDEDPELRFRSTTRKKSTRTATTGA